MCAKKTIDIIMSVVKETFAVIHFIVDENFTAILAEDDNVEYLKIA